MTTFSDSQIVALSAWRLSPILDVVKYFELLKLLGDPAELLNNPKELSTLPALAARLSSRSFYSEINSLLKGWYEAGIGTLFYGVKGYPEELYNIPEPPLFLSYRGSWQADRLAAPRISIVGARKADRDGVEIADHFARELAKNGNCVVSGLALGVDGAAHRGAISSAQDTEKFVPTIAVCGSGLNHIYPRSHSPLAKDILDRGGVLLSQFEPSEPAYPVNFLNRNRIIAALSLGTLVVQASEKSGSLVTARHAIEYGKELFIVPGSIKDPRYAGSNRLLQHGAHLVTNVDDLFDLLPPLARTRQDQSRGDTAMVDPNQQWIIDLLRQHRELHSDELFNAAPEPARFFEQILALELSGLITRLPGNCIALSTKHRLSTPISSID